MTWRPRSRPNRVRVVRVWVESVNEVRREKFSQGFECTKSARSLSFASFRLLASVCWRLFFRVKWNAEKPVQVAPSLSVQGWMGWTVGCEASPSLYKVCEVLLIWKRRFLIRFVQQHSRWNVKLSWDFFLGVGALGCSLNVLAIDSKNTLQTRDALARPVRACIDFLESSVACYPRMKKNTWKYQRWLAVHTPIQPIHL